MSTHDDEETFCGATLLGIGNYYAKYISGYLDIPVCLIGMVLNAFNLLVFTRKNMLSPVHSIFANLAFVDFMVLLAGIPYSGILNLQRDGIVEKGWTYSGATVYMICEDIFTTFHLLSVFFTVQLAAWRYIAIAHPLKERIWCNMETTRNVMRCGYVVCISLSIPIYFSRHVEAHAHGDDSNNGQESSYITSYTDDPILRKFSFMVYAVLGTILPSVALSVFSLR
ncbi:sex peptide receptor-related protein 2-like [Planococcus citri]|uniref:sex peptide receptor-related protein 2-like n=1 Tax=Planococcus citri TaxID=170843 RepID=UPI0031F8EFFF